MTSILDHPRRQIGQDRMRARTAGEQRRTREASKLSEAIANMVKSGHHLSVGDRELLARNIGLIAAQRSVELKKDAKALLRLGFEHWIEANEAKAGAKDFGYRWRKRQRWARLPGEELSSERLASKGSEFVALAEAMVLAAPVMGKLTADDVHEVHLQLLAGTDLDPFGGSRFADVYERKQAVFDWLRSINDAVKKEVPGLPKYFATIANEALTHRNLRDPDEGAWNHFDRDVEQFETSGWTEHGGPDEGHLIPEALHNGHSLTEEGNGTAATMPRLLLADIRLTLKLPAIRLDDEGQLEGINIDAFPTHDQVASDLRQERSIEVSANYQVHLVVAPWGGRAEDDLQLALVVEARTSKANTLSAHDLTFRSSDVASIRVTGSRDKYRTVAVDVRKLTSDGLWSRFTELSDAIWLASGEAGLWLLLSVSSQPMVHQAMTLPHQAKGALAYIERHFEVPRAPLSDRLSPLVTLAGMIERNDSRSAGMEILRNKLIADAARRVATLESQRETR